MSAPKAKLEERFVWSGRGLAHARVDQKLTQAELGARAGLSQGAITRFENHRPPTLVEFAQLAQALRCEPGALFGRCVIELAFPRARNMRPRGRPCWGPVMTEPETGVRFEIGRVDPADPSKIALETYRGHTIAIHVLLVGPGGKAPARPYRIHVDGVQLRGAARAYSASTILLALEAGRAHVRKLGGSMP